MSSTKEFVKDYGTLIITLVTAFAYLCAYLYQWGYLEQFHISPDCIVIDLTTLLKFASYAITICALAFLIVLLIMATPLPIKYSKTWVVRVILLIVLLNEAYSYFLNEGANWLYVIQGSAVVMIVVYQAESQAKKHLRTMWQENFIRERPRTKQDFLKTYPIAYLVVDQLLKPMNIWLFLILFSINFSLTTYSIGRKEATEQRQFKALASKPSRCLIRVFGETYYFLNYDAKRKMFGDSLQIVKLDASTGLELVNKTLPIKSK